MMFVHIQNIWYGPRRWRRLHEPNLTVLACWPIGVMVATDWKADLARAARASLRYRHGHADLVGGVVDAHDRAA